MFSSLMILLWAFTALDANADEFSDICGEETLYATMEESVFTFVLREGDTIPVDTKCNWTITQVLGGEDPARSILVYLLPTSESDPNQCVELRGTAIKSEQIICAEFGQNVFEYSGQTITVLFPGKNINRQLKPFTWHYKLGNTMNSNCGPTRLTSEDAVQYIQVPIASNCIWLMWANKNEPINIFMKNNETAPESNHCVNVTRARIKNAEELCTANASMINSNKQPITITYASPNSVPENSGTFRVYYRMENCGQYRLNVSDAEQQFSVYTASGDIPERHICGWIVVANNKKLIEIKLDPTQIPNQCIEVRCRKTDIICGDTRKNVTKCFADVVYIEFPATGYSQPAENFRVIYKSVNEESSSANKCENIQLSLGSEKHTFNVANGGETIPQGHHCKWSINDSSSKPVRISLETMGTETANQCVNVNCSGDQTEREICAVAGNNSVTCILKPVIVIYPAKSSIGEVRNFQVTYQLDSAKTKFFPLILLVFVALFCQAG